MTSEEQYCHHMLAQLRVAYEREAKPYIDRLVQIKMMEAPRYMVVAPPMSSEDLDKLRSRLMPDVFVGGVCGPIRGHDRDRIPTQLQSAPVDGVVP